MDTAGILLIIWAGIIPALIIASALTATLVTTHHKAKRARIEAVTFN